ncbi:MAG: hypothetical protein PHR19_08970 [Bacteroidales bacterium]|nr:hypothetical protein [Bacteroidales bacterium]
MEKKEYEFYKDQIDELLDRTLFSYPFYDKSDDELILDARKRTGSDIEFGLFKLGEPSTKEVFVDNNFIETKYITLTSTLNTSERPIEIKLSSFIYPLFFIASLLDKKEKMTSTFNYQTFSNYNSLFSEMHRSFGETVLITSCWHLVTIFFKVNKCINIVPTPKDDKSLALLIRKSFVKERSNFIKDFLNKPYKYISFYPVDKEILNEVFQNYKQKLKDELNLLEKYDLPSDNEYF